MKLTITGRNNLDIPQNLRDYIEEKSSHLKKYFNGIIDVHVILFNEKLILSNEMHLYGCEMTIHGSGFTVHGEESGEDMRTSVDKTLTKVESQVRKYKDRLVNRKRKGHKEEPATEWTLDVLSSENLEAVQPTRQVIRSKRFAVKPMSLDEAVMQLDLLGQDFIVFRDSETQRVNVLYLRRDGNYGLIEPQF